MADVSGITAALPAQSSAMSNPLEVWKTVAGIKNLEVQNRLLNQDVLNRQQDLSNAQLTNQIGSQHLAVTRTNRARQILFDLSNRQDSDLAGGQLFQKALDDELLGGTIDQNTHDRALQQINTVTQQGGHANGALYRPLLNSAFASTMSPSEQVEFLKGKSMPTTLPGGQTQYVNVPGLGSAPGTPSTNLGTPVGGGVDPSSGTDIVTLQAPDGSQKQFTRQQINDYNLLQRGYKQVPGGPQGGAGGDVGQPAPTPAVVPPAPSTPPPSGPGAMLGVPLPNEGQKTIANASRVKDSADMAALTTKNFNDMKYSLETIRNLSPTTDTGHGTEQYNLVKQIITNMAGPVANALGIDPAKSDDQAEMMKMLSRAAAANGNRSDADLFQSIASNPNASMPPGALQRAAGYVLALNAQESVLTQAAHDQATHNPLDLSTHNPATRLRIQNELDPVAFRSPYMSAKEWSDYRTGLDEKGKAKLHKTFDLMDKYLPQPSGGMQPTAQPNG